MSQKDVGNYLGPVAIPWPKRQDAPQEELRWRLKACSLRVNEKSRKPHASMKEHALNAIGHPNMIEGAVGAAIVTNIMVPYSYW